MKLLGISLLNQQQIEQLMQHHLKYALFPHAIEQLYRQQYQQAAAQELRYRAPIIFIFYLLFVVGLCHISGVLDTTFNGLAYYIWVGLIILLTWCCTFFSQLDQYFDYYSSLASMATICLTLMMMVYFPPADQALFHIAIMSAVVMVYAFVGLRLYPAILASFCGALVALIILYLNQTDIAWNMLSHTYALSIFLGMALAYVIDRQYRFHFLQHCLIQVAQHQLAQQTAQLEHVSRQDSLTGLANRRYMSYFLDVQWPIAIQNHSSCCIMMLDIDYFKRYNDTLGHIQGDECLKKIAQLLQATTLRQDELAIRYGGEEFLLIFPHMNQKQAEQLARYLLKRIQDLKIVHPTSLVSPYVSISLGLVCFTPQAIDQVTPFIHLADQALYQAKHNGRNCYVVHQFNGKSDQ